MTELSLLSFGKKSSDVEPNGYARHSSNEIKLRWYRGIKNPALGNNSLIISVGGLYSIYTSSVG
jgi:hypothetical protein